MNTQENGQIYKAIPAITRELGAIGKTKKNAQQGFMYRGIDDVMNALNPLLGKHEVTIMPKLLKQEREVAESKNGTRLRYSICTMEFTFYANDGSSMIAITSGEAMDSGDKATNKAMAIAYKYACFQVFCIATELSKGIDPDGKSHETVAPPSAPQVAVVPFPPQDANGEKLVSPSQVRNMFNLSGGQKEICQEVIKKYGYASSKEVRESDYEAICHEIADLRAGQMDDSQDGVVVNMALGEAN
jgi:hypothetical protein